MSAATEGQRKAKLSVVEGRRELHDIIRTARGMEERRLNPFLMDISQSLEVADRYFPHWKDIQDLMLDARALNSLSRVVKMQESRLRYQAQLFHADPEAMAEKLQVLDNTKLARVLLESWHPVVELEQLTAGALEEALDYWDQLPTQELRHRERPRTQAPPIEEMSLDDLLARGIIARQGFGSKLLDLWDDLKARGSADYYQFIQAPTRAERIERAYGTSYLVTYGYAVLSRSNGSLELSPKGERDPPKQSVSLPIVVV
ncbi:MAG TPA: hypothetical protein VGR28_03385 [Candidatus Thermoplasmatota archaeon]|jgi:hypothetical protein|nr:hypothetical protein [Candidatus Thermoplasmatota archaeon]